jgi:hypothetical protein
MSLVVQRGLQTVTSLKVEGTVTRSIMGENTAQISFSLPYYTEFLIGDTITIYGDTFRLKKSAEWDKISSKEFRYKMEFRSVLYDLGEVNFLFLDDNNELKELDFSLMGTADTFVDLIVANANRAQSGWSKGTVDVTDTRNLTFSRQNCLQVLSTLAQEFETEFWIIGQTIHLTKKGANSGLTLQYGQGNGLYTLSRKNKGDDIYTRLYALGGNKNLPGDYRNYSTRVKMPVATGAYLEQNVDKYGVIEHSEIFEEIYPKRVGTITSVVAGDPLKFSDSSLDFNLNNQMLPGISAKVIFQTGQLAGYRLEIAEGGYNHTTKQITLRESDTEKALVIPSALIAPQVGDTYFFEDVSMPSSYITAAEQAVEVAGAALLAKNCNPKHIYSGAPDRIQFKKAAWVLGLGEYVTIKDAQTSTSESVRVLSYSRDINEPYLYHSVEFSDSVSIIGAVRNYNDRQKIERAIIANGLLDPNTARNNWRNNQELLSMVFDSDGFFTDKIKPLSIETSLLTVGARSQQFQTNVLLQPNYGGNDNAFVSSAGVLDHFTINPSAVRSWNIAASSYPSLGNTAYYIYAKCEKASSSGTLLLSTSQITVDQDVNYYHFLMGVLHSPIV